MLLMSYQDVYGHKDKHYFVNLCHRNERNDRNGWQIHHFAKLAIQLAAVLSAFFTEIIIIN